MSDVVAAQRAALDRLYAAHVGPGSRYTLLDFPDHANVGDSAIWLGELAMLRRITGRDPDYISTWHDFDHATFARVAPTGTLFLHGGGNLGDLWPHHQRFRETILATVRDRPIVQLPQSIHFSNVEAAASSAKLIDAHPNVSLYVRDENSVAFATRNFSCPIALAPDSAFALEPTRRTHADLDVLALLRSDLERAADSGAPLADPTVVDWLEDDPGLPSGSDVHAREAQARARVERGLRLLSRGRMIVTDRLHGHILAMLLGIPHRVLDNVSGKVHGYVRTWTASSPLVTSVADWSEIASLQAA